MSTPRASHKTGFEIVLPATSANLGPAFDTAAMAVRLHLRVRAWPAKKFSITASGCDANACGRTSDNLLLDTYREVLQAASRGPVSLAINIENQIPLGKGLGSSAAARLAGIALAVHFGKLRWPDERILAEAAEREQHGDNVAACWLGGVALIHNGGVCSGGARNTDAKKNAPSAFSLQLRAKWPLLLVVPEEPLSTEEARAVLPSQYSRCDAVANVQSAMWLAAALAEGRPELLQHALQDRIHEPYRGSLCPLLAPLRSLAGQKGILGAVLSGAGPSVLVVLDPRISLAGTKRRIADFLRGRRLKAELLLTAIESRGASQRRKVLARN